MRENNTEFHGGKITQSFTEENNTELHGGKITRSFTEENNTEFHGVTQSRGKVTGSFSLCPSVQPSVYLGVIVTFAAKKM